ncbi:hypothetical protein HPP92_011028 [Vanilla planifolia]|uniref:non-specific serine/threonine protein kinase n=1 Tax=Vanilla planifolia TaxID=51239 RepID=A0A835QUY4_VANPL|nr:hypothetical protein HPP92_011028 [Vanilla planifolia]
MNCCSCLCGATSGIENQALQIDGVGGNVKLFSHKELKAATANFNPGNKVGAGGFGSVYKGTLKNGANVAVKVLSSESTQGAREFLSEIAAISEISHENLVKLYGACIEGNHRMLVYNYLENNSLAQTLLGTNRSNIQFSWGTRRKICVGIARGLEFLHEEVEPHILHRDIKASNILLDKDLTPKISDFGLAKTLPPNATHVSTRVAGTANKYDILVHSFPSNKLLLLFYLEDTWLQYAVRGQVTKKSDIYSFGVLLLEIVSGRCNTNTRLPYEEQFLLDRTWALYEKGELERIIDATMSEDLDMEEACRFLKVGLLCTQDTSTLRPSISTVLKMLTGEKAVESIRITKPGLISDLAVMKITGKKPGDFPVSSSYTASSNAEYSGSTAYSTMTLTAIGEQGDTSFL